MTAPSTTVPGAVALVTGASRGIGLACARALSERGMRVALVARDESALREVAGSLPGETLVLAGDVTSAPDVEAAFAAVESAWGPVEVLVLAAGGGTGSALVDVTDEDWQATIDLNLTAPFRAVRRALPAMTAAGSGRIVVVASVVAKRGEPRVAAYTAAKHGVLGLVRSAAAEVARTGVTVNAVCPGYVDTPMTDRTVAAAAERTGTTEDEVRATLARRQPIGRLVTPEEVAAAVLLCVDNAAVNGQGITVDGGGVQS
jgi:NAD(P)-dependent dehydrogenase (short-subunit alcohol dehydrogenase family)